MKALEIYQLINTQWTLLVGVVIVWYLKDKVSKAIRAKSPTHK